MRLLFALILALQGVATGPGKAVGPGVISAGGGAATAPTFDVAGAGTSGSTVSSLTAAHTVTNGITNAVVIAVIGGDGFPATVTGCTFNGTTMTAMWNTRETQINVYGQAGFILPVGTGDGVAHNVVCTIGATAGQAALITESWSGVNQSTPNRTAFTTNLSGGGGSGCNIAGSVSLNVSNAVSNDAVVDGITMNHPFTGTTQTIVKSFGNIGGNNTSVYGSRAAATGATTMGYTFPTSPEVCGAFGAAAIHA